MVDVVRTSPNPILYSIAFLLAFALSVVMLMTDTNLRTDFGTMSSGYYAHWYVILGTAIADLIGAALLLLLRSRTSVKLGVLGSGLLVAIFIGAIFTYSQVGFSSASDMANYLFGVTDFGGDIRYLYDVLLAVYIATFLWGAAGLALSRGAIAPGTPAKT
ncbi:MAG TPA: hypothetical protein VK423_01760 [Thermoplasmata archaeon]|nr:hypothetical protein [Thermoplasmata archaeon]